MPIDPVREQANQDGFVEIGADLKLDLKPTRKRLAKPRFDAEIFLADSSWIRSVQYDPYRMVFDVTMKDGGRRYRYRGITPHTFALIVTAKSSGSEFDKLVRPYHKGLRLPNRLPNRPNKS